jgi:uroporphyrinogen-III synthase
LSEPHDRRNAVTTARPTPPSGPLVGRRIAVLETRELSQLMAIFQAEGAVPVPFPLVAMADADPEPVDRFLRALAGGAFDDLILLTGEGLRRLMARAEHLGRAAAVRAALVRIRKVTRGPKPARALHELGLSPDLPAPSPTTDGVIEALSRVPLRGRSVGVQLAGAEANRALTTFLTRAGATVQTVAPYTYSRGLDGDEVGALLQGLVDSSLDAIAFTSGVQVDLLFEAAAALDRSAELTAGLGQAVVAAIGPVTAEALRRRGIEAHVTPGKPFAMRRLVATVGAAIERDPRFRARGDARRLLGRRIAIPEHRELDRLAEMLEAEGASTVRCPLMAILDTPDQAAVETWLRELVAGRFADVVFLTGEGVRRLLQAAARARIAEKVVRALGGVRKITRGPKPARALHEAGLSTDLACAIPTSKGVIEELRPEALAGRHVGVQLFGDDPNVELCGFLEGQGAHVHPVAPYRYAPATHDAKVSTLIDEIASGRLDAIAFTTAFQIERLFQVARARGTEAALRESLSRLHVAAVGPVVVEATQRLGVRVDAVPARQFFMRRLAQEIAANLGPKT